MDKIIVSTISIVGIIFVYWFFFMKKEQVTEISGEVTITVEGGYTPSTIAIPNNTETKLIFFRKDPSSCLEEIVIPDFHIRKFLPLNKKVSISITPQKAGSYSMSCGMNMFHGKIIVQNV